MDVDKKNRLHDGDNAAIGLYIVQGHAISVYMTVLVDIDDEIRM